MTLLSTAQSLATHVDASLHPIADLQPSAAQFVVRDGQTLLCGSVSPSGTVYFPAREFSLEGGARDLVPCSFGPRGTLYSYSTVHVSSTRATPYRIGYVDFENGVRVLAEVRGETQDLGCDVPVELRSDNGDWFVVPQATAGGVK